MVSSTPIKTAFIVLTVIGLILTLIALFTPAWRSYENPNSPQYGLVTYDCGTASTTGYTECTAWWNQPKAGYERAVLAFMILAAIAEIITLIWAAVIPRAAPRHYFIAPILALLSAIFLLIAFVIWAAKNADDVRYLNYNTGAVNVGGAALLAGNHHNGYSFWLAVVAFIFMVLATLLGFAAVKRHNDELRPISASGGRTVITQQKVTTTTY